MIEIANRGIGYSYPPYFVADVGSNWDGSLDRALGLIELAAQAGASAVKFQNFREEKIVSRRGFEEVGQIGHQAGWSRSVYETYAEASIPVEWTETLVAQCGRFGVTYLTTPYDLEVVDALDPFVPAWKIGSGDITWHELIRRVASKGKPVLLGTGASTAEEVDSAMRVLLDAEVPVVLMQCNSNYEGVNDLRYSNLRVLDRYRRQYRGPGRGQVEVGLSDHTPGLITACAAVALGAVVVEKHFTDDSDRPGPDHSFAMNPVEWRIMVEDAVSTWEALGDGRKMVEFNERDARVIQRRALRWRFSLPGSYQVVPDDLVPTRPCPKDALPPNEAPRIIGRHLARDVEADTLVGLEDVE